MKKEKRLYNDENLVPLYETLNPWSKDNDFYFRLAGETPQRILDAGCGTGMLAVKYAEAGHEVIGIDPASKMIDLARSRKNGDLVEWQVSDLQRYTNTKPFDLIVMTGHAFQCLLTDQDISEAFHSVSHLLARNGRFVFESRNPDARVWENWTSERSKTRKTTSSGLKFDLFHNLIGVDGEIIKFEEHFNIEGKPHPIISLSTLRFAPLNKIKDLATAQGLSVEAVFGDWESGPLTPDSPEIIITLGGR